MLSVCAHPLQAGSGPPRPDLPKGQKHEIRHEIDQLEEAWRQALLKQDSVAMGALLANDYMAITAYGTLQTKDQALANLRSGRMHFTTLDISDRKVRFYGKTALVTSQAEVKATTARRRHLRKLPLYARVCARCAGHVEDSELRGQQDSRSGRPQIVARRFADDGQ